MAESEQMAVEKVLFDFTGRAALDSWHMNIYGENEAGKEGSGASELIDVDAPFGERAVRLEMNNAGRFSFFAPRDGLPDGDWRQNDYYALEIWYRGNGSKRKWDVKVQTTHPDPDTTYATYGSRVLFLGDTEWRRLVITGLRGRNDPPPLDFSQIRRILFLGSGTEQIEIGRIALLGGDRKIPLTSTDQPTVFVPEFSAAPTVDGQPSEPIWHEAAVIGNMQKYVRNTGLVGPAAFPGTLRLGYNGGRLYLGAELGGEPASVLSESRRGMNERLWEDPSIELLLDPGKSNHNSYQYIVNAVGTTWDKGPRGSAWEGRWETATDFTSDQVGWALEMSVDLAQIADGQVERGDIWGINIVRNSRGVRDGEPVRERSGWSQGRDVPVTGFGWLVFGEAPDTAALEIEHLELYALSNNRLGLRFLAHNRSDESRTFDLQTTLTPPALDAAVQTFGGAFTLKGGAARFVTLVMDHEIETEGDHRMQIALRDSERAVHWHDAFVVPRNRPIEVAADEVVLRPVPQVWAPKEGVWMLPESFRIGMQGEGDRFPAEHLAEMLRKRYGVDVNVVNGSGADIALSYESHVTESDEGFVLDVETDGVAIKAQTGRGMYYGIRALLDIVRQSSLGNAPAQARAVHCEDWPAVRMRVAYKRLVAGASYETAPSIAEYKDFIYNQIAGGRYNLLFLKVLDGMIRDSHPHIARGTAYTKDEVREILDYARRHYVEVAPGGNSPGHGSWFIRHQRDLAYEGDRNVLDMRNPEMIETLKELYAEDLEVYEPRYYHLGADEVRWPPTDDPEELAARRRRLLNHWTELIEFFADRGVTPVMWDDMLSPGWNGGEPHHTARILPDLPRDVIIAQWTDRPGLGNPPSRYRELGFDIWRVMTGFGPGRADRAVHWHDEWDAAGMGMYAPRPWQNFSHIDYKRMLNYSIGVYLASAVTWNPPSIGNTGASRFLRVYGPHWTQTMQVPEWGVRQLQYEPIALGSAVNHSTQTNWMSNDDDAQVIDVPAEQFDVSGIPFERIDMPNDAVRVEGDQQGKPIAIGQRVRGLAFLHTAGVANDEAMRELRRYMLRENTAPYAMNVAHYVVRYEDGETMELPVKLGWNVHFWNCTYQARIMAGVSGYWTGFSEAQHQRDPHRPDVAFWAMEWKNPRPDVLIDSITLKGADVPASVALLGVTAVR